MDAKDLRIETALGERNDGSKYSQSGVALQCNRNKSYQDIGSNPLAKAEVAVRPCAVIGPDRVVPPPASNDAYLKKAVDLWPCSEYPPKPLNNVNPSRNISPRQTFQENMQRIMVPPTYSAVKHAEESNLNHVQERNAALSKNSKQTMAPEAKYCDVPYTVNLLTNEHKNAREAEMCAPSVNSPMTRATPHGWPPNGVNMHAPLRAYGPHDVYQYPQYPSCAGPRPSAIPMARPHRTFQEDGSYVYPDSYYQDASVRFKPYPSVKERYPQARYDYISSYPNPFHPPPPYAPHKYDIPNARPPQPYPVYSHLKYLDNRVPDPNIEAYQRPNQQTINYNMQFRNQIIHPPYASVLGNTQNKLPSYPQDKSANKLSLDTSKAYVDYENAKAKYSLPDNYFVSEMARVHQVQKQVAMPNYVSPGMQPVPLPQYHRKDHMTIKNYEYMPHYRHFEHPLGFNHSGHHPPQFSPSTLAISPTDSNTSNDTANTQSTSQEDCGYVSQSSTASARSVDRLHNDYHRRYDYRYRPIIGNSQMLPKPDVTSSNSKENNKIDVRQFLSMWNEGDEDNTNSNTKEISIPNNYRSQENAKSQDQLYVLGLVNVSSEELAKYEHIQKVSKLPENIKGYNSIELLNQFEEVIESSNINSFKTSTTKEFMPMKDRRNAIKQIVEVLPRPVSPLDVESKISQSVIHKEVGCNFEIKPCSPKMLNVEIAAPVQNILGERAIEKVSNPLSNKVKSPLSMRIDGNTACNKTQRQDSSSTHTTYENVSCKMIGSPFTANRMESVKNNYILQDLETSSGVCLASLPRLDNEIELNFPEVNQQFINANKGSHNIIEKYPEGVKENSEKICSVTDNNEDHNNSAKQTNLSSDDTPKEHTKLSKFRITKLNSLECPEDESSANAIRTDSVIIENPENTRKSEDNKEKTSLPISFGEEENTPMNLSSQNSSNLDSESGPAAECALDFSLNKSENSLPLLNAYDDELINTMQKDIVMDDVVSYDANDYVKEHALECSNMPLKSSSERTSIEPNTNSIIVRNNQSATTDYTFNLTDDSTPLIEENHTSPQISDKSYINENVSRITSCVNVDNRSMQFDYKKTSNVKASSTNVIVKHRHKNKSKSSKIKNLAEEPITEKVKESSFFDKHLNKNIVSDSKDFGQNSNITKSVIQSSCASEEHFKESAALDIFKVENSETSPNNNIISENSCVIENNDIIVQDRTSFCVSVNEEIVDNSSKITNKDADSEDNLTPKSILVDIDGEKEDNPGLNDDKNEVFETGSDINQLDKHCNNLITESTNKTNCEGALQQSPSSSFLNNVNASGDAVKLHNIPTEIDISTSQQKSKTKNSDSYTNDQVLENVILESDAGALTMKEDVQYHDGVVFENEQEYKKCSIVNNELNSNSFNSEMLNKSTEEKVCCEKANAMDYSPSDEIKVADITKTPNIKTRHYADVKLNVDKKYRTDSGYQSSKSSLNENDESIFRFSGNLSEDAVFLEQESDINKISSNENIINNNSNKEPLPSLSKKFTSTSASVEVVNTLKLNNKNSEMSTNKSIIKTENIALDDIDANMEIIFAQPKKEKLSESVNNHSINNINLNPQTGEVLNIREKMEIDVCSFVEAKEEVSTNSIEILSTEFKDINELCEKSLVKVKKDKEAQPFFYNKKYRCHGKELHSPWIQKLLIFNEGKTDTQIFERMNGFKLQETKVKSPMHDKDIDVNVDNFMLNVNGENSLGNTSINSDTLSKDVELKSTVEDNIITKLNDDRKPLENVNIENVDIDAVKQLKESIIDSTKSVIRSEDVEHMEVQITNNDKVNENNDIVDQSIEILSIDRDTNNDKTEDKFLKFQTTKNHDDVLKSLEEPILTDIERVLQNENVDYKSFKIPNIDNVLISEGVEIDSFDVQMVENNVKIDTIDDSNLKKESESIQETIVKIDMEFEKEPETNIKPFINCSNGEFPPNISMDFSNIINVNSDQKIVEINKDENSTHRDNKTEFADVCVKNNDTQNDLIDSQEISFSYPNNSVTSQITEDTYQKNDSMLELKQDDNDKDDTKFNIINEHFSAINQRRPLKRSFSDSALNGDADGSLDSHYSWPPKRNRINELEKYSLNNRRNSMNVEENVSFCILIDDNCIITEENEEKICIAELQEEYVTEIDTGNNGDNSDLINELDSSTHETGVDYSETVVLECENENPPWVDDIACAEEVFSDEVAENVVISAPSSPTNSALEYEHDEIDIYGSTTSSHTNKVKLLHEDQMSEVHAQIVETLYRTPDMNIMNKTLLYGDKTVESDSDQENIIIESDDWKPSPTHTPDYIDPTNVSSDFHLETPENKENVFVKDLSPLRRIDDYLDSSSAENDTDDHITPHHAPILDKVAQDETVYSSESSLDNVFDYKLKDELISTTQCHQASAIPNSSSSSPEVSSTTSEDKNSGILLKITNLNGSRVSQINEIQINNRPRCKFTEKKGYSTSNLNFPNRPLMTKAAQKYIPPIKESIRDLKVKITLPQQSLLKLKQLKLSRNEPKVHKQVSTVPRIIKKPKPNFDDVLKSIDEIQIKRHKEKSKKIKTVVPKVIIKKNENGSHYASTPKKDTFSPDLTGRKWQPWVFLEKNNFIDKMAVKNKTKAIFSHRKKTYVLAEKFKKYKSVNSAKFVISQPKTPGQLKYTIRLKHSL